MKSIGKVFISSPGNMIYPLCIMQSSQIQASKRETFMKNLHFRDYHMARTVQHKLRWGLNSVGF